MLKHNICAKISADVIYYWEYKPNVKRIVGKICIALVILVLFEAILYSVSYGTSTEPNAQVLTLGSLIHNYLYGENYTSIYSADNWFFINILISSLILLIAVLGVLEHLCYLGMRPIIKRYRVNVRDALIQKLHHE